MPKAVRKLPSADYLRQCFEYDATTGELRWRHRPVEHFRDLRSCGIFNTQFAGRIAGSPGPKGYLTVSLNNDRRAGWQVARIIYKMQHGIDPEWIDHKDRDRRNNTLDNLRSVSMVQNNRNMIKRPGKTGYVGVGQFKPHWHRKQFYAVIRDQTGKKTYLGSFNTAEEAHEAYRAAANRIFGEFSPFRCD